jgi:hypothetical protein
MKTKILNTACLIVAMGVSFTFGQNIGINTTGAVANPSAMLDIDSDDKGLLIPRVALTSTADALTVPTPANWLLVFNTATISDVTPGMYYWNGTLWVKMIGATDAWLTNGNAGTNAANQFVGTTDNIALRFRTNNVQRFEMSTNGQLRSFGSGTAAAPTYTWNGDVNNGIYRPGADLIGFTTDGNERFRIPNANQVHAMADGTAAIPFYSWEADPNTGLYRIGNDILGVSTNGTEQMRIEADGDIGINTIPNASAKLHINSNNKGLLIPNVALTAANVAAPVAAPSTSLFVYNTATAGAFPNDVYPGYYYWDGARWDRMVDNNISVWVTNPINLNANTRVTMTVNIPGVQAYDAVCVNLAGDWAVTPQVTVEHVEARTNQVRFTILNRAAAINYIGMDFMVSVIKP